MQIFVYMYENHCLLVQAQNNFEADQKFKIYLEQLPKLPEFKHWHKNQIAGKVGDGIHTLNLSQLNWQKDKNFLKTLSIAMKE